jgi:hypothetical protein
VLQQPISNDRLIRFNGFVSQFPVHSCNYFFVTSLRSILLIDLERGHKNITTQLNGLLCERRILRKEANTYEKCGTTYKYVTLCLVMEAQGGGELVGDPPTTMINNETRGKKEEQGRKRRMGLEEGE